MLGDVAKIVAEIREFLIADSASSADQHDDFLMAMGDLDGADVGDGADRGK